MQKNLSDITFLGTEEEFEEALTIMQEKFFIVNRNGKVYVLSDEENVLTFTDIQSFNVFYKYLSYSVPVGKSGKQETRYLTNYFFTSGKTKRINSIIFEPSLPHGINGTSYNVWKGFKYKPVKGDVKPFLDLLDVNCNGDIETFEYFLNYLAFCIQYPEKNPRTAIAIIGDQGTGKGTLINDTILKLTDNSKHIDNINQLIGEFNGHLADSFFICLDEASFGGDIKESNRLKTFISESKRFINDKGKTAFTINSYSKLFILSNNDYIVNVEQTDRRYCILKASDKLKGNFAWFDKYQKWLKNGGYNYIMNYLLARDISNFNPLQIPQTQMKIDLQLKSADLSVKFLYDLLAGNIDFDENLKNGNRIYRNKLYEEFVSYCKKYHPKAYLPSVNEFNKTVVKAFLFDDKENWRTSWKDKIGYYYVMDSLTNFQERYAQNIFKVAPETIFYNHEATKDYI